MMRLMYITNDVKIGEIAQKTGVDWIFVDLEYIGKEDRQANRNTVISAHTIGDVKAMRKVIDASKLLVRINPLGAWSKQEINEVIDAGADIIMLPFFKTSKEVKEFLELVDGKVQTCLLVETMDAVKNIEEILSLKGIDYIHIGLNDLHIERKTTFMFEFLANGSLDRLLNRIKKFHIPYGFGGMARIGKLLPPAEHILMEHYRLGSTGVILARSFCNYQDFKNYQEFEEYFVEGVKEVRAYEQQIQKISDENLMINKEIVKKEILEVVMSLKGNEG